MWRQLPNVLKQMEGQKKNNHGDQKGEYHMIVAEPESDMKRAIKI